MAMCNTCNTKYEKFSKLKMQLDSVVTQTVECSNLTTNVKNTLSSVVICGLGIDKDDTTNIGKSLESIKTRLESLISQCSTEMSNIESACPGSSHYKIKLQYSNTEIGD